MTLIQKPSLALIFSKKEIKIINVLSTRKESIIKMASLLNHSNRDSIEKNVIRNVYIR